MNPTAMGHGHPDKLSHKYKFISRPELPCPRVIFNGGS